MLLFLLFASLLALAIYYVNNQYTYWQRHGFPYDTDSKIPYGSLRSLIKREKSMGMNMYEIYLKSKESFLGIYLLFRPAILVRNAELACRVLAQDFSSFHDRGVYVNEKQDPFSATLFALRGKDWRAMRNKLSPAFTSGKLKSMFPITEEIGDKMVAHLNAQLSHVKGSKQFDLKKVFQTYAIDVIASTIFGLEINSFKDPNNEFTSLIGIVRRNTTIGAVFGVFIFYIPRIANYLFRLGFKNPIGEKLLRIVKETIEYREKHNIVRKDLLQLLMQLRNTGKIDEENNDNWNAEVKADITQGISLELITAQAFIFYVAGQESTGSTAAFTIFELAQYPELLKRVRNEVDEVLKSNKGKITYEALQKMEFLDLCIQETLRKYPGLPLLNRVCTHDYKIPDTDLVIPKGTPVIISVYGMHRDAAYFPEPEKYDPERFSETNRNYDPHAYMPFGDGPRVCIAPRMGKLNAKLAIVKLIQNFDIEPMEKHEIEVDNHSLGIIPKGGVPVRLTKRQSND